VPYTYLSNLPSGLALKPSQTKSCPTILRRFPAAILTTEPWFPTHRSRDLYISLLSHQQSPPETTPPQPLVDDKLLMSALLLRAAEDVRRIHRLRVSKQALAALIQSGSLNEDVQARLGAAEKEMEAEVVDVVSEANSYRPGWGGWIFSSASEMVGRDKIKEILGNMDRVRIEEGEFA
jgi:translocation protein SEC66